MNCGKHIHNLCNCVDNMKINKLLNTKELKKGVQSKMKILTPIKSIRAKCLDCRNGSFTEVKLCTVNGCALHPYRLGHRPRIDNVEPEEEEDS